MPKYIAENEVEIVEAKKYDAQKIADLIPDYYFFLARGKKTVVLKPNWILDKSKSDGKWEQIITHPAIITAVIYKLLKFLTTGSKIIIAEGPDPEADFNKIIEHFPVRKWQNLAARKNISFEIVDLRDEMYLKKNGVIFRKCPLAGDPKGATMFNLRDRESEFYGHKRSERGYYGTEYNRDETNEFHNGSDNLYSLANTPLLADLVINLPKLKTHKKTGITCALKNIVGITQKRNLLPHHSEGTAEEGGDQYPSGQRKYLIESRLLATGKSAALKNKLLLKLSPALKKVGEIFLGSTRESTRSGNWYGNDTAWRMVLDLNKIFRYCDKNLKLAKSPRTNYLTIVDAIIAGEGSGPLEAKPKKSDLIITGQNPLAVDTVCAYLMGFATDKIPMISNAYDIKKMPLAEFNQNNVKVSTLKKNYRPNSIPRNFIKNFEAHPGWKGYIEISHG